MPSTIKGVCRLFNKVPALTSVWETADEGINVNQDMNEQRPEFYQTKEEKEMRREGTGRDTHINKKTSWEDREPRTTEPRGRRASLETRWSFGLASWSSFLGGELGSLVLIQGQTLLVPFGLWEKFQSRP